MTVWRGGNVAQGGEKYQTYQSSSDTGSSDMILMAQRNHSASRKL